MLIRLFCIAIVSLGGIMSLYELIHHKMNNVMNMTNAVIGPNMTIIFLYSTDFFRIKYKNGTFVRRDEPNLNCLGILIESLLIGRGLSLILFIVTITLHSIFIRFYGFS